MKSVFVYVFVLAVAIMAIPALALANMPMQDIQVPNTLVSFKAENTNALKENADETAERITLNENVFTTFKVLDHNTNTVFEILARDYVVGAVCAEMPALFEEEALKAQAVAVYTYAVRQTLNEIENPTSELLGANFSTDPNKYQAYYSLDQIKKAYGENFEEYYAKVCTAVDSVFGQVLIYDGEPIIAAFHSMSSGMTESAENVWGTKTDYLVAVESSSDIQSEGYLTQTAIGVEQMRQIIESNVENADLSAEPSQWFKIISTSESKTVLQIEVGGVFLSGTQLRAMLNLRSAAFEVTYSSESGFVFTNFGYGHGVGMSQFGANEMAKTSCSYNEILSHYYKGAKIAEIEIVF